MNRLSDAIVTLAFVGVIIVAVVIGVHVWGHGGPTPTTTSVAVRDRNDSIRIAIQAVVIAHMDADLKVEKRKRVDVEWSLRHRDATVKMLRSIIDTLQAADSTGDSVSVPAFVADTVTAKGDTVHAEFAFVPKPMFSLRIGLTPIDTFFVAHDSLITKIERIASPTELGVGVVGGMTLALGVTKDNTAVALSGGAALLALTIYQLLR